MNTFWNTFLSNYFFGKLWNNLWAIPAPSSELTGMLFEDGSGMLF